MASPRFSIIHGGGETAGVKSAHLVLLDGKKATLPAVSRAKQLGLNGIFREATSAIISLGIYDVDFSGLEALLTERSIRQIIDIRLSNSFDKFGYRPQKTKLLFRNLGIKYIHCQKLANPYLGMIVNKDLLLAKYEEYLRHECKDDILKVMRYITEGPTILLGWSETSGKHSERDVLLAVLRAEDPSLDFDLEIMTGQNLTWYTRGRH